MSSLMLSLRAAAFDPSGRWIITAGHDLTARLWDAVDGHAVAVLRGHTDAIRWAAFDREGARAVTASDDGTMRIWQIPSGRELLLLEGALAPRTAYIPLTPWPVRAGASRARVGRPAVPAWVEGPKDLCAAGKGRTAVVLINALGSDSCYGPDSATGKELIGDQARSDPRWPGAGVSR